MGTIGTSRVVLAILAIAFLLFNPAGICAGTMSSSASPSHPCCPAPAGQSSSPCICIDRQPAAPTLPSLSDQGPAAAIVVDSATVASVELPRPEIAAFDVPIQAPHDRSVSFHQLLL